MEGEQAPWALLREKVINPHADGCMIMIVPLVSLDLPGFSPSSSLQELLQESAIEVDVLLIPRKPSEEFLADFRNSFEGDFLELFTIEGALVWYDPATGRMDPEIQKDVL